MDLCTPSRGSAHHAASDPLPDDTQPCKCNMYLRVEYSTYRQLELPSAVQKIWVRCVWNNQGVQHPRSLPLSLIRQFFFFLLLFSRIFFFFPRRAEGAPPRLALGDYNFFWCLVKNVSRNKCVPKIAPLRLGHLFVFPCMFSCIASSLSLPWSPDSHPRVCNQNTGIPRVLASPRRSSIFISCVSFLLLS